MEKLLEKIQKPSDLSALTLSEKECLAEEIRDFLVESLSKTGGHLAPNLGVVELTIALHSVFQENSKIVWDVGHQSYVHKLLTGRMDRMNTLRKLDGMSGFPKRSESPYDCFDTGHSSTSISAAVGFAIAERMCSTDEVRDVYAVIGDGALTGGMAYEAINHLGNTGENVKIILNDNEMSISRNVGGLVDALRGSKGYSNFKKGTKGVLFHVPLIGKPIASALKAIKRAFRSFFVGKGQIFEDMGIKYLGEVDGHSIAQLERALLRLKNYDGAAALHVHTVKGKGYHPAEENPSLYHGVGAFDPTIGVQTGEKEKFSSVFGKTLTAIAAEDERVVAISAAMIDGTGLAVFEKTYPHRIFDVGIAEQHAVTMAAAMALGGLKPFVAIYSTFLQRAYDQIVHDVCLQNAPVVFCIDRAGVVGADGETHQGIFDISYLSSIPNLNLYSVSTYAQLQSVLKVAATATSPVAIRYPRGGEVEQVTKLTTVVDSDDVLDCTGLSLIGSISSKQYKKVAIFSTGRAVKVARAVSEEYFEGKIPVYEVVKIKPLSEKVKTLIQEQDYLFTIEDHIITGGFGSLVEAEKKPNTRQVKFGFDDFVPHGTQDELYERYGLNAEHIAETIRSTLNR